jgi:predicted metal-binding membrane protein
VRLLASFLAGYAAVWAGFGALAFLGDMGLHHLVEAMPWLAERPWLLAGGVLATAGGFQFTPLKQRCQARCRHPAQFLLRYYDRGPQAGARLGTRHGLFCLGCCWALMLLMFAVGVAHLAWMATLTALMTYEKTGRHAPQLTRIVGLVLLAWATLVLIHPSWLPAPFSGA